MKATLRYLSMCTFGAALWLVTMESLLQHSGYRQRILIDALLALQSAATITLSFAAKPRLLRYAVLLGALGVSYVGAAAVYRILEAPHFEGFVLVIGGGLVVQGMLTWLWLLGRRTSPRPI
ncbi:MAG TPA: hypothetical protein VH302_11710 [Bryobacteraceae bacterium]|nr:hypothetical protein [Bryobacteraceae bacterium]